LHLIYLSIPIYLNIRENQSNQVQKKISEGILDSEFWILQHREFSMNFSMIDRIVSYEKDKRITALKTLSLCEEYLADHFPSFPIMPGVLMLETMAQAGAWLLRLSEGFTHSVFLLSEVRAVRYGSVVKPGNELLIDVAIMDRGEKGVVFKGQGKVGDRNAVVGRFVLTRRLLDDAVDEGIARFFETQLAALNISAPDCSDIL
jgi:3-hydroxyacyl-[acyl-carrier-protein] dehydratase